jgi:single-strand DNA-binding protein
MNTVTLIGRLGKDPALRYTANERAVCEFPLAVDNRYSDEPDWFTIVVWGKTAETVAEHKTKGDQVAIRGHLTPVRWETENGDKRSTVKVTADDVTFLNRKRSSSDPQSEQPEQPEPDA